MQELTVNELMESSIYIKNLMSICLDESKYQYDKEYVELQFTKLLQNVQNGTAYVLGEFCNGNLQCFVWCYTVNKMRNIRMHISFIAVFPEFRKKGLAASMLNSVKILCEEREIETIELNVSVTNKRALGFYEKQGLRLESYQYSYKIGGKL